MTFLRRVPRSAGDFPLAVAQYVAAVGALAQCRRSKLAEAVAVTACELHESCVGVMPDTIVEVGTALSPAVRRAIVRIWMGQNGLDIENAGTWSGLLFGKGGS
jgi:hypothetical protein